MLYIRHIIHACFLLFSLTAYGQTLTVTVRSAKSNEPLAGAIVQLKNGDTLKDYRITDTAGKAVFDTCPSGLNIEVRMLGYETVFTQTGTGQQVIHLEEVALDINASVIKAEKVTLRGDTISYNLPALTLPGDRTLKDLLRHIPGIEVNEQGYVQYNGKPINKFYVEGNDVLESRYNLVVQNLPTDAVTTLQVLEHHQPVKALEGIVRNETAALNLILDEKVRAKWMGVVEVGGGFEDGDRYPLLSDMFLSRLSRKSQLMAVAKFDASGRNIIRNMEDFHPDEIVVKMDEVDFLNRLRPQSYLHAFSETGSVMGYGRSAFNQSLSSSFYSKSAISPNYSFSVSADYEQERLLYNSQIQQEFFDKTGTTQLSIDELSSGRHWTRLPALEIRFTRNDTTRFVNDHFRIRNNYSSYDAESESKDRIGQRFSMMDFEILNAFSFIKRNGRNKVRSFSLFSQYSDRDEQLNVFEADTTPGEGTAFQQTHTRFLYNRMDGSISMNLSRLWTLEAHTIVPFFLKQFQSDLQGIPRFLSTMPQRGLFRLFSFRPAEDLRVQYKNGRFRFTGQEEFAIPLIMSSLKEQNLSHLSFNTHASCSWHFSPEWLADLSLSHRTGTIDEQALNPFLLMESYHSLVSRPILKPDPGYFIGRISLSGQKPLKGLSMTSSFHIQHGRQWRIDRELRSDDNFVLTQTSDITVPFTRFGTNFRLNKSLFDFRQHISFSIEAFRHSSSLAQKGAVSEYDADHVRANVQWIGSIGEIIKFDLQESASLSRIQIDGAKTAETTKQIIQKASVSATPVPWLQIDNILDGNWNTVSREVILFWDVHFDFLVGKTRFGVQCNNILNHQTYRYRLESPLSQIVFSQPLRPFTVNMYFAVNF